MCSGYSVVVSLLKVYLYLGSSFTLQIITESGIADQMRVTELILNDVSLL